MTRVDEDLALDAEIAAALPKSWPPFFSRFGRLREVQRQAIPEILAGRDALLIAPTASGKTEAACAPLVERNLLRRRWTILYISPTRALVNDLFERLSPPLSQLGLNLKRRTGDHRDPMRETPHVILTTPESFDSLLCRGRLKDSGHVLGYVTAVVLDEIHLLHGSARGEQVRWLLHRLRRVRAQMADQGDIRRPEMQVVALSATVPDPQQIAEAYLGPDPAVVSVRGSRPIELVAPDAGVPDVETSLPAYLRMAGSEKVLVFSNSRKRVDQLARDLSTELAQLKYEVRAHHGSLAQPEREATEEALKREGRIVVCATMTLELGIDIGDVDLVVLDSPAPSVAALLQRVGRGNRRTDKTRLMMCSGSTVEALIHSAMLIAARNDDLGDPERGPQFAVARQQLASYIFQAPDRSRPRAQIVGLLSELLPTVDATALLDHFIDTGEFREDRSGFRLGDDWLDRTSRGEIHSNIQDAGGYDVADARTGVQIGKGIRSQRGRGIGVAGRLLEVKGWDDFRILVSRASDSAAAEGEWSYVSQAWMRGAGQPQALRTYLQIPVDVWPVLQLDRELCVFHFGGSRRKAVLKLVQQLAGVEGHLDDWTLRLRVEAANVHRAPSWLSAWKPSQLEILLGPDQLASMERTLARPQANRALPMSLRVREVSEWLDLDAEHAAFGKAQWLQVTDSDVRAALSLVASKLEGRASRFGSRR